MEDLINKLPDNCLQHIFSFLDILERLKVERVCKRWYNIGKEGWPDKMSMGIVGYYSDNTVHSILKRCGRFLRDMTIWLSSKNLLWMIIKFCKLEKLESITIHYEPYRTDEREMRNLRNFFEKSQNLTVIKIYGNLGEYWIDFINLANPTTLRELVIMNEKDIISFNPNRFPNLRELELQSIVIPEKNIKSEKESLKGLEIIRFSDCYLPTGVIQSIKNFTNLQDLFLQNNICNISNEDIREIASYCDKLRELHLAVEMEITDFLNSIVTVNIPSLTSGCFQYLGEMPSLEILSFKSLKILNSHDIVHLTNVRELTFDSCPDLLPDDGLIQLITNSSNLEELRLYGIHDLDITFVNHVKLIFHDGLRQKHLYFMAWIDYRDELCDRPSIVIDEPLLKLRVHVSEKSSEEDKFMNLWMNLGI